ncbi:hypothetical protein [Nocardioides coralli]|uniref:hypothetical protein n=1 Tax=Nocardioides coralli TaxID=2872154 RepID=UPI001CA3A879|nr:hypothetical protein [Nocardioides coralli]QZY28950.1 hypothetical protein K6T13_16165 [Nocardioides coralli]
MAPSGTQSPQGEMLEGGPPRPPLLDRIPARWRLRGVIAAVFVVGTLLGGSVMLWAQDDPAVEQPAPPAPSAVNDVRLVLSDTASPPDGEGPLRVDAVLLHSRGSGTATVTRIHRPGRALDIRVPELPVELSVNDSFERVRLFISPRHCELATRWTPSAQPLALTWRDQRGVVHQDLSGDHDATMELALIRHMDAACGP